MSCLVIIPQAYKSLVEKEGTEGALRGLGLTEEQLFFVGFAQVGVERISSYLCVTWQWIGCTKPVSASAKSARDFEILLLQCT